MFLWCLDREPTMVRRVDRGEYLPQSVREVEKKRKDDGILTWMIKQKGTSGQQFVPFKISPCAKIVPSTIKIVVAVKNRRALKCYLSVHK